MKFENVQKMTVARIEKEVVKRLDRVSVVGYELSMLCFEGTRKDKKNHKTQSEFGASIGLEKASVSKYVKCFEFISKYDLVSFFDSNPKSFSVFTLYALATRWNSLIDGKNKEDIIELLSLSRTELVFLISSKDEDNNTEDNKDEDNNTEDNKTEDADNSEFIVIIYDDKEYNISKSIFEKYATVVAE